MSIDKSQFQLQSFHDALASLELAIAQPKNEFIRDSVIQRFEFSFELAWKLLKRYFETFQSLEVFNIPEVLRKAARQNLISDSKVWFEFHVCRNKTSHMYSKDVAEEVYEAAIRFLPEAKNLLMNLSRATNGSYHS